MQNSCSVALFLNRLMVCLLCILSAKCYFYNASFQGISLMVSKMIDFSLLRKTWTPVVWLQENLCSKIASILLHWRSSLFLGLLTSIPVYVWRRAFTCQESSPYIWWKFCTYYWTPISFNIKCTPTCYWINSISFCARSYENMWMVGEAASSQGKKAGLRWTTRLHLWQRGRREARQRCYTAHRWMMAEQSFQAF